MSSARLGVLVSIVLALAASAVPAADATTDNSFVFVGTAQVGAGIAYPCTGTAGPDVTKCPPPVGSKSPVGVTTETVKDTPVVVVTVPGKTASITFSSVACGLGAVNRLKAAKEPVEAGTCSIGASGTVTGYCGLSGGVLSGTLSAAGPFPNTVQTWDLLGIKFAGVGGALVLTGPVAKRSAGGVGKLIGVAEAVPTSGSCNNKAAKTFTVAGVARIKKCTAPEKKFRTTCLRNLS